MIRHIGDIAFSLVLFVGSICLWFVAHAFPKFPKYRYVDSNFWPEILLVLIGALSFGLLIQNVASFIKFKAQRTAKNDYKPVPSKSGEVNWKMFISIGALCMAYFGGLQVFGFLISTMLFLWVSILLISGSNWWFNHVFPIGFTLLIMFFFVKVLELSLPRGMWIFRDFSLLFY